MTITNKLNPGEKPTREQVQRIKNADKMPIVPDEDSPIYTPEQLAYLYSEAKKLNKPSTQQDFEVSYSSSTISFSAASMDAGM